MKTILIIPITGIVLISAYFGITYTHDYIFYISNLDKLEFEETYDNCYEEQCRQELETKGFVCNFQNQFGYVCIPPVDQDQINQRLDYWDQLFPPSYAYIDLIYDDKDFAIGLLKEIEFIDENQIKAIFAHDPSVESHFTYDLPDYDYQNTRTLSIGDTFVPRCHNHNIMVYKLQDIVISDDVSYAVFVYRIGATNIDKCVFPQLLENSFDVRFDF